MGKVINTDLTETLAILHSQTVEPVAKLVSDVRLPLSNWFRIQDYRHVGLSNQCSR